MMINMDSKIKITININKETIKAYVGKTPVAQIDFLLDETQINVADLTVVDEKQLQGYGYLMLNALKGVAQFYKKPIYLISYLDKVQFYRKNDFLSLGDYSKYCSFDGKVVSILVGGRTINIRNLNPDKAIENQLSSADMLWIPSSLKEMDVYL